MSAQTFEPIGGGRKYGFLIFCLIILFFGLTAAGAQVLGDPEDVSRDFQRPENVYFIGNRVADFDVASGAGNIVWDRYLRTTSLNFNKIDLGVAKGKATEFPGSEYDENPSLPFAIS